MIVRSERTSFGRSQSEPVDVLHLRRYPRPNNVLIKHKHHSVSLISGPRSISAPSQGPKCLLSEQIFVGGNFYIWIVCIGWGKIRVATHESMIRLPHPVLLPPQLYNYFFLQSASISVIHIFNLQFYQTVEEQDHFAHTYDPRPDGETVVENLLRSGGGELQAWLATKVGSKGYFMWIGLFIVHNSTPILFSPAVDSS